MNQLIHILEGGPDRWLITGSKTWRFEDHPNLGPMALTNSGEPMKNQPDERSLFWLHAQSWYDQGKKVNIVGGKTWCVYETEFQRARR